MFSAPIARTKKSLPDPSRRIAGAFFLATACERDAGLRQQFRERSHNLDCVRPKRRRNRSTAARRRRGLRPSSQSATLGPIHARNAVPRTDARGFRRCQGFAASSPKLDVFHHQMGGVSTNLGLCRSNRTSLDATRQVEHSHIASMDNAGVAPIIWCEKSAFSACANRCRSRNQIARAHKSCRRGSQDTLGAAPHSVQASRSSNGLSK